MVNIQSYITRLKMEGRSDDEANQIVSMHISNGTIKTLDKYLSSENANKNNYYKGTCLYMDEKQTDSFGNICTIVGGVFLGLAIADQISKTPIHEIQKLASGEMLQELKMLPDKQEKQKHNEEKQPEQHKYDTEQKSSEDEMADLKRKLAEYENKSDKHKSGSDRDEEVY